MCYDNIVPEPEKRTAKMVQVYKIELTGRKWRPCSSEGDAIFGSQ